MNKDQYIAELKKCINDLLTQNYKLVGLLDDIRRSMVVFKDDIDVVIGAQEQDEDCCNKDCNGTTEGK